MAFEKDLFISYTHNDNKPLFEGQQQGWITRFHKALDAHLSLWLGKQPAIWRDDKLTGLDKFDQEIHDQLPKSAMLVSVISPRYLVSQWCTEEVRAFCEAAAVSGGDSVGNRLRIAKVIMIPVDNEDPLPAPMRQVLGYPFYFVDEQQRPIQLDPAYGDDKAQMYNLKIAKLAYDLSQNIKKLEAAPIAAAAAAPSGASTLPSVPPPVSSKPVVYLAQTAYDCRDARDQIEADLRTQGYTVLPDKPLSNEEDDYLAAVRDLLDRSKLSIHLIGAAPGLIPDGPTQRPAIALQNELAIEKSRSSGLARLIWLPERVQSANPVQQQFIDSLRKDASFQFGADLIAADLEALKGAVYSALRKLEQPPRPKPAESSALPGAPRSVYVICDDDDRKPSLAVRKFLKSRGHGVETPVFEGDAALIRRANDDQLAACDAVLIYYGAGDPAWYRSVKIELRKLKGTRSERPLMAEYTYLDGPRTSDKQDLIDLEEPCVINGFEGFAEARMTPFLDQMERS